MVCLVLCCAIAVLSCASQLTDRQPGGTQHTAIHRVGPTTRQKGGQTDRQTDRPTDGRTDLEQDSSTLHLQRRALCRKRRLFGCQRRTVQVLRGR
jgi:hypothetical protein